MWKRLVGVLVVALLALGSWVVVAQPGSGPSARSTEDQTSTLPIRSKALLIPGYGGGKAQLRSLGTKLSAAGIEWAIVDVGDGQGDLRKYAKKISNRASKLKSDGYAVDLVGYSAGGISARIAASEHPDEFRRVVTLSAPHHGTTLAEFGAAFGDCPEACQQMRPSSPLLVGLEDAARSQDGQDLEWLSIYSTTDEVIRPAESSELAGADVEPIQETCPDVTIRHGEVPTHGQTVAMVVAFLAGESLPDTCVA